MITRERAASVDNFVRQFATGREHQGADKIAAEIIGSILHWVMRNAEMVGEDGRKPALGVARVGLSSFISDVHRIEGDPKAPETYTLITVRTEEGLWVSETGHEEMVE
ncbi:hypothetical protein Rleg9DRAFT_1721 [Rhizobium leguminosarum bv. trifolii WSM597]|uniref:Uncharacterized protein n=1 Tax=Rhizobium leguminosarum bv. trifolii WSM597 TaxID=754764 RepID=I9N886_RHILT|nr:hypothetical protein [Rhizobium leguminosarum]EJB02907.1 hypothetical protein Rleg9DRAFT_1721 [Rhizobium leguminosarum bv. trifolii WSM597]